MAESDTVAPAAIDRTLTDNAPHLLIIDDDSRIRSLLSRYLGEHGFRVTSAADAGEARRRLAGLAFDLLIVDVMMPGEDGLALTKSLRETMSVPILMLTARSETESRIKGLEFGADDYLAKPFEPRELLLRINSILRRGTPTAKPLIELVRFGPFTFHCERLELRRRARSAAPARQSGAGARDCAGSRPRARAGRGRCGTARRGAAERSDRPGRPQRRRPHRPLDHARERRDHARGVRREL